MSSVRLEPIIEKFPDEKRVVRKLASVLSHTERGGAEKGAPREYTFEHLFQLSHAPSVETFSRILTEFVRQGALQKLIRVESPETKGGIKDFPSISAVPEEIFDWRTDRRMIVQPQNLRVIFRVEK